MKKLQLLLALAICFAFNLQAQTITTGTVSTNVCAGATISVPYTITGSFTAGNVFTAQLSSSAGAFTSPVAIGTLSSTASGTITATIPTATAQGSGYRIRVVSSAPVITGSTNVSNITVNTASVAGTISDAGSVYIGSEINMALGKPTSQSSTINSGVSSRAVDGNTDGFYGNNSVTNTAGGTNDWWEVDLQGITNISSITLWNRTDCCFDRLSNFYILTSAIPFASTALSTTLNDPNVSSIHVTNYPNPSQNYAINGFARYVRIQLSSANQLNLAEVQVFSEVKTLCINATTDRTLTLANYTGTIQWQSSTTLTGTYANIAGATSATYDVVTTTAGTTYYRAVVTSGACSSSTSMPYGVTIITAPVAGTISGAGSVCMGSEINMALGKPTSQSSTANSGVSSRAVDGNTNGNYANNSVTNTAGGTNDWWEVDLQGITNISSITLWNRTDCCLDRLSNFYILTSAIPFASTALSTTLNDPNVSSTYVTNRPNPSENYAINRFARYVRIQLSGTNILSLAEVQVFSKVKTLTLAGAVGSIQWESSANNTDWTPIAGATTTTYYAPTTTAGTFYYRAVVSNGACSTATAASTVIVNPVPVAGTISGPASVCINATTGRTLTLANYTGTIQWQSSTTLTGTYTNIAGATSATYNVVTTTAGTTYYRAVVTSGVCSSSTSVAYGVTINTALAAGTISGAGSVCMGGGIETNIAIGQPTSQSSTTYDGFSSRAVDGNTNGSYFGANSVTNTAGGSNDWWEVDLQGITHISSITLWNRTDCCSDRLDNFYIITSELPFASQDLSTTLNDPNVSSIYVSTFPNPSGNYAINRSARYIRIQLSGYTTLNLAEVQVFSKVKTLTLAGAVGSIQWESSANNTDWTPIAGATTTTYNVLTTTAGTFYYRAVVTGCGTATTATVTVIVTVPDAPTGLSATAGINGAFLTFTAPANNGCAATITNYQYSTDNGASWTAVSPASSATSILISGLSNCTAYNIRVRAVNSVGVGAASTAVSVTPRTGVGAAGINWTLRTSAADNGWYGVTYGNGLFVALAITGTGNRVMTSPDGITWTLRTSAADNNWVSVTYGNGLFVAVAVSGTGNRVMTSPDGITWTLRTSAADNNWRSVTYGNGLFVAVANSGTGNRVMTSPDGITWTLRNSAADNEWFSVTYGNGLFVAVAITGTGNRVMTSPDGITWTTRTVADNEWRSVTYGNGLFVAVALTGTGNRVMTSPDGITWTLRSSAADNTWVSVTYGNGLFVAVAVSGTGNRVMSSPDGITWTIRTSAANNDWASVTYGNGLFVAVAVTGTGNRVMTSSELLVPDSPVIGGIIPAGNYATVAFTAPASVGGSAISNYEYSINGGSSWVTRSPVSAVSPLIISGLTPLTTYQVQLRALNSQGTGCASATTNATTTAITAPDAPTGLSAEPGINGALLTFTAPSNNGGSLITNYQYSTDNGASWTAVSPASTNTTMILTGLSNCTAYNILVRAVNSAGAGAPSTAVSVEPRTGVAAGTNWTLRTSAADNSWNSVTYGNGLFVALATTGTGNRVMTSPDGITWTIRTSAANNNWYGVTYGNGLFVAVATTGTGNRVMTSPDGITWTLRNSAADNQWLSVTYGNGLFVAVAQTGAGNRVMTSPDGITWTLRTSAADNQWTSVTYANGLFVAVASTGTGNRVMTSPDGITWTIRTSAADNQWWSVTYGNGLFVAVALTGTGNRVMTSPDGITWTSRSSAADNAWEGVTYGNGLFVAVAYTGTGNRVMTSPDGITWTIRTSAADNNWRRVTYGNGLFVAVAQTGTGNRVMTSSELLVPDRPVTGGNTPSYTSIDVAFTAPASVGGSAISNYEYSINGGSSWVTRSPAATTSPLTISGLSEVTSYQVQLRAVNAQGSGCASATVNVTTLSSCTPTSSTETVSACGSYTWNGTTYTTSNNTATWVTTNAGGCDSTITLNLTITAPPVWYLDADNDNYYTGSSVTQCVSPGAGYRSSGLLGGNDCDDTDASLYQTYSAKVDSDGDGYSVGSTLSVCGGSAIPSGYVASGSSLGEDCDDANAIIWRTGNFYDDADGDLYRVGSLQSVCYGAATPTGYITFGGSLGVDCNDADATVWTSASFYADTDGDLYYTGAVQTICYGATPPSGYVLSSASLGTDCDDANATIWRTGNFYEDADGDLYRVGTVQTFCYGANAPPGYVSSSADLGADCDDFNSSIWRTGTFYTDADGDFYGVGLSQTLCYGATPPSGYVLSVSFLGVDCDDANVTVWQSGTFYTDTDGDGYHGSSSTVCYGSVVPGGLTSTLGSDCSDSNSAINPAAIEVCEDFIDNDCDGGIDENCSTLIGNDSPTYAVNMQYSTNMNYPNCYPIQGNFSGSTDSPESITFTGPDEWYKFTAQSTAVSITLTSAVNDDVIELYQKVGSVYTLMAGGIENAGSGAGDFERLNYTGLTPGVIYYISVGAANGAVGGSYSLCIQHLMSSTCAYTEPVGGFNLCNNWKATYRGAPSNGVTYTFNFTGVGGNAATPFATTTLSGTNGLTTMSNPAFGLRYGGEYDATVDVVYTLQPSAGAAEVVTVNGSSTGNCNDVTIMAIPALEVLNTQRCPATLLRSNWLRAMRVNLSAAVCGVTNYTYEFTQVAGATSCSSGNVNGLPITLTTSASSPYLGLGGLPALGNVGAWDVRIRSNFGSGASAYSSAYGPTQRIQVAGTSASGELEYEIVDAEKEMDADMEATSLYPNPNNGDFVNVNLSGLEKGQLQVRVLDAAGRAVTARTFAVEGSLNTTLTFDEQLSAGVYMIETLNAGRVQTQRLVVQ